MKKRKLSKAKAKAEKILASKEMQMNQRAKTAVLHALKCKEYFDCIGHFIFFATISGDAWLIDHREYLALRLAERCNAVPYKIIEDHERFFIEWTENFTILEGVYVSIKDGMQSTFFDYPTDHLYQLISVLRK